MKTLASIGLAAGLAISLATAANATPILVGSTTDPTGINNLVVDGTTYDVTFSLTTLNSPFAPDGGKGSSTDAAAAISAVLNNTVTSLNNFSSFSQSGSTEHEYWIDVDNTLTAPFQIATCIPGATGICSPDIWFGGTYTLTQTFGLGYSDPSQFFDVYIEAADFTPVGVPEPLTLSLFGATLAGAVVATRRRRKANKAA